MNAERQSQNEAAWRQPQVPVHILGAAPFAHQLGQGTLGCRNTRAVNHMVRQAVPCTNEPEYRSLHQCRVRAWAVLLQLAVVLVGGSPRAVVMFSRGRGVKEGRQICMSLSGHAEENGSASQYRVERKAVRDCGQETLGTW